MRRRLIAVLIAVLAAAGAAHHHAARAGERSLTLASTTSTDNSGLFAYLLPVFEEKAGIKVHVIALGTGQAIRLGEKGDADALLVHDTEAERKFVAEGHGLERRNVMYNDYVIVGPAADPARIAGLTDAVEGLRRIGNAGALFASRGDDSGTHRTELRLWREAAIDVRSGLRAWYRETGSGMGATLNTAVGLDAYALTDRATWVSFKNRRAHEVLVQGDALLFNQYGIVLVNPARHPHTRATEARAFADWLTSGAGQAAIGAFRIEGQQMFFPNALPPGS
ncbi:MAG: substrate-binding domain-containing protein [Alphaproteobacteria bacterium]